MAPLTHEHKPAPPKDSPFWSPETLGFAAGNVCLTATFGYRTALFQPEYLLEQHQLLVLALHAVIEAAVGCLLVNLALTRKREASATALFIGISLGFTLIKAVALGVLVALLEIGPWGLSWWLILFCGTINLPASISFTPVLAAAHTTRLSSLPDGTTTPAQGQLPYRLGLWLASAGLSTLILGPDTIVRALGFSVLFGTAAYLRFRNITERRTAGRIAIRTLAIAIFVVPAGFWLLHPNIPPRPVVRAFAPYEVQPYQGDINAPGLSLWIVGQRHEQVGLVVGYNPETRQIIQGKGLLHSVRADSLDALADAADSILYRRDCCVQHSYDTFVPSTQDGPADADGPAHAPRVEGDKLIYWSVSVGRDNSRKAVRSEAPFDPTMIEPSYVPK